MKFTFCNLDPLKMDENISDHEHIEKTQDFELETVKTYDCMLCKISYESKRDYDLHINEKHTLRHRILYYLDSLNGFFMSNNNRV